MKRWIWSIAALCLAVCLLVLPPQTSAADTPAGTWMRPGEAVVTEQAEFVLLGVKMLRDSSVSLQYRVRAKKAGTCRLELIGGNAQSAASKTWSFDLTENEELEGNVRWPVENLQRVMVTLPSASGTAQFTYAIN